MCGFLVAEDDGHASQTDGLADESIFIYDA
jgi:hypothetical protein